MFPKYIITQEHFGNKEFYEECANTVIDFCKKNKIEHHIKYGTKRKDNKKTEKLFLKPRSQNLRSKHQKQASLV